MLTPVVLAGGFSPTSPACATEGVEAARPGLSWWCARFGRLRLGMAGSVPPASTAVQGHEVSDAPASPSPNPTPSARAALSEAEVEKSVQMGMAVLEQLP
jgi:hypothetical protein